MAEIVNTVVDRRRREEEHLLFPCAGLVQVLLELAVARFLSLTFSGDTGVAEVVSLINQYDVCVTDRSLQVARESSFALKVGVIVGNESDEAAIEIG